MQYPTVMDRKKEQKNLGGMMDADIVDKFVQQTELRGWVNKRALAAAAKLWLQIPEDIQSRLINEETSEGTFIALVQEIVQEQLVTFRKSLTPEQQKIVEQKLRETKEEIAQKK